MKFIEANGHPTPCLFASQDITAASEILYDYKVKVPWESEVSFCHFCLVMYWRSLHTTRCCQDV